MEFSPLRGITDDNATLSFYVFVVFRSHVLFSLPSHSFTMKDNKLDLFMMIWSCK